MSDGDETVVGAPWAGHENQRGSVGETHEDNRFETPSGEAIPSHQLKGA